MRELSRTLNSRCLNENPLPFLLMSSPLLKFFKQRLFDNAVNLSVHFKIVCLSCFACSAHLFLFTVTRESMKRLQSETDVLDKF